MTIIEIKMKIHNQLKEHNHDVKINIMRIRKSTGTDIFFEDSEILEDILNKCHYGKNHHRILLDLSDSVQINIFNKKRIWTELRNDTTGFKIID